MITTMYAIGAIVAAIVVYVAIVMGNAEGPDSFDL
jgi:hypothetical protein